MPRKQTPWLALVVVALGLTSCTNKPSITHDELVRRSQELFDSVAAGNQEPWKRYFAEDAMYFDEKGRNMDKTALVADITPLPAGYSGTIRLVSPKSHIESDVAILSYDLDETETIYGQHLTARYHATDTWMRRNGHWQIVAGQVLRYYEDPATATTDTSLFRDYIGNYELAPGVQLAVSAENGHLYRQRAGRAREALLPEASDLFFRKGVEGRILFRRGEKGKVDTLVDRRNNEDVLWKKVQ